ncbi:nuclear factor 7, ovary-like [Amblyraja radiata]|uniref:nuclear factor 7, ovary-like n=1 Tax=Amblyraja radiata TaxID=386614 RepID=UPI00140395CC|nr:nuclear factor 7, ovary-like [Amblyraja radiata]
MPRAAGSEEQPAGAQCPEHGQEVELYCTQDKKPLCRLCVEGDRHRGHSISPVNESIRVYQNELKTTLDSLKERKAVFTAIMDNQERKISALKGTVESLGRQVTEEFAAMRRFLDERERVVRRELAVHAGSLLQPLEGNLRAIQRALITLQKDIIQCQAVVNQWDSLRFLQEFNWLRERPREEVHCPAAISAQPCLGLFRGPLQYRVWKEMRSCISPGNAPACPHALAHGEVRLGTWAGHSPISSSATMGSVIMHHP